MTGATQIADRRTTQVNHWCRVVMNRATTSLVNHMRPEALDVLEISGKAWAGFGFRTYQSVDFPSFDICSQRLPRAFDLIIAEQVFEHIRPLYDPERHSLENEKDFPLVVWALAMRAF